MNDDTLPPITKQELLTKVRACLREESESAGSDVREPLVSIADSLDHHVERLFRLSRRRTGLPDSIKQRLVIFRIPLIDSFAAKFYSMLFADANEGLRETAQSLDLISQALRSLAADRKASHRG